MKRLAVGAILVALICSIIANVLLYLRYSSNRPLMTMGDTVITRKDYRDALEMQHGKPVLRKLVMARLVEREARAKGIMPKESEVDARLKQMESTASPIMRRASEDGMALYNLRNDVRTDIALERLRLRDVKVTDAEVATYYKQNSRMFVRPMQVDAMSVVAGNESDARIAAKLLQQDIKPYAIAQQPRLNVVGVRGFQLDLSGLSPAEVTRMQNTMGRMSPGQIATVPIRDEFLVVRVRSQRKMGTMPLGAAREDATRLAKLAKAPPPTDFLLQLYQGASPVFEANLYAEYFRDFEEARVSPTKTASVKTSGTQTASR